MKKIFSLLAAVLFCLSFQVQAKNGNDMMIGATCLVEVKGLDEHIFLNTLYVKSVSADARLVIIGMASNYSSKGNYYIKVNSMQEGRVLVAEIVEKINNCHKPR